MVKRLWIYLRKNLLALGQIMGRNSVISFIPLSPMAAFRSNSLAQLIRFPGNTRPRDLPRLNRGLLGLCLVMLLPLLACVSTSLWSERKAAQAAHILVPVHPHQWKEIWPSRVTESDSDAHVNLADPENPETQKIWKSALERGESRFRIQSLQGAKDHALETVFWLRTRLSEQDLARAYYLQANVLYLGLIQGRYRVYVDGDLMTWDSSGDSAHPVTVSLPLKRLQEGQPLSVAIEISQIDPSVKADVLGGKSGEGFVTPEIADNLIQARHWETELEPLICATAFGIFGALFFFGWLTQRRKQEYAYFAAFAFLQASMHACEVDFVRQLIGSHWMSLARPSFLLWEGTLAMLLGFALARTRASWMIVAIAIASLASAVPFASSWLSFSIGNLASWQRYLFKIFVPLAYGRGAFACLIQWNVLSQRSVLAQMDQVTGSRVLKRRRDLRRLGFGLLFVGALYAAQALLFATTDSAMSLLRLSHFFILLVCYGAGVFEDRFRNQLQPVTQISSLRTQDIRKAG